MAFSIPLGTADRLTLLFSYPNAANSSESLAKTIEHWFGQTLARDGLADGGASAAVSIEGACYVLNLDGPPLAARRFPDYGRRLLGMLDNGWAALTDVVPRLVAEGKWDPQTTNQWRFFLPWGLPMLNQRSLQFFHYPPIRLLDTMRDYLDDPVPVRWAELLTANDPALWRQFVKSDTVTIDPSCYLYETVVDATPIAAPDDQGSAKAGDKTWGLIPIQYFPEYQMAQVRLILNTAPNSDDFTIPIVVYGSHPRDVFAQLYGVKLGVNVAATAKIVPGKKTAVLGSNHPYRFYAGAQIGPGSDVGCGKILPGKCPEAKATMIQDLIVARWQLQMADDPTRDPQSVLAACTVYWNDPARADIVCTLVQHQGSLRYPNPPSLEYRFDMGPKQASAFCAAHKNDPCAS